MRAFFSLLLCLMPLCGCTPVDPTLNANALAKPAFMQRELVATHSFTLASYVRLTDNHKPLSIYIEGDGRAWLSPDTPSSDPTPRKALGLALAAIDPAANVVYIARPCQFTLAIDAHCDQSYWTGKRYAPEVVASINEAIDHFAARAPGQPIHLVGYSGGGAIAALIAAQRHDVASLRTIAGNLDVEGISALHHVSPMPDSLNPMAIAPKLRLLPQEHLVGDADTVVPPSISEGFLRTMGDTHCSAITHVDATHEERWQAYWRGHAGQFPRCHGP